MTRSILALAAGFVLAIPALAAPPPQPSGPPAEEARIPFVDFGGVYNFRAYDDETVYIQDRHRDWYRAEVIGPCRGLPWAERIGVDTRGSPTFDRFATLLVEGERCQLTSLVRSEKPPKRRKAKQHG
jgi:hypothetical protein